MARHHHEDQDYPYREDNTGRNVLGITVIALLVIGLAALAYFAMYNPPRGSSRVEVNTFEITPQEAPVGRSAVREAPSDIELPNPDFDVPPVQEPSRSEAENPAQPTDARQNNQQAGETRQTQREAQMDVNRSGQ